MKKCSLKCLICVIEPQSYLKIKYSRNIPTLIASTWSSRWGQLIWIIALDSRGLVWPEDSGKQGDLATKSHSDNTELLKVSKIYLGFKSSPTPTDLYHMYKLDGELHHFVKNQWHMTHDMRQVTCDPWHVTYDLRYVTCESMLTFSQNCSFLALTVWDWRGYEDLDKKYEFTNQ